MPADAELVDNEVGVVVDIDVTLEGEVVAAVGEVLAWRSTSEVVESSGKDKPVPNLVLLLDAILEILE